ncbi:hypothetical protein O181_073720 [Austropuccinia psidii MF-1]|uniref:Uncharacterized protein n=1 Tax=Austropuccinia psidii MF-1 TaxID=1389203 RepID=A0A9Q3FB29_9BASI|nr:hypothetical protein [Austropuccinia psidii MF-1]
MTKKKQKSDSELHQKPNYPTFRPGYHNPLTKHSEAECRNLKLGKPTTSLLCAINQQDRYFIILDSGASKKQNPFAERGSVTPINKSRCLLLDSGLDLTYWAEAENTAVYLENLTLHKSPSFETPFSQWFNKKPSLWM